MSLSSSLLSPARPDSPARAQKPRRSHRLLTAGLALLLTSGLVLGLAVAQDPQPQPQPADKIEPLVLVMNYPYEITGEGKTLIHACVFRPDFSPAAGATVSVNDKEVGKVDANGTCVFEYVPGAGQAHKLVAELTKGNKTWRVTKGFACNGRTTSFRSDQLYVYTDRGVYNPGDTIHARLIAWELLGEYTAIADAAVEIHLATTGGKTLTGARVKTNEFGVAAVDIPLPETLPEDTYELVVLYNKAREVARLQVKRFVPPVIEISHNLKRWLTPQMEALPVHVELSYPAGGSIQSSSLKLRAKYADDTPDDEPLFEAAFEETEGTPGVYDFELSREQLDELRDQLSDEETFQFEIEATDSYGRSSLLARDVVFTGRPYRAVLECDKDDYPAGETVQLLAKVVDLDGKPARGLELTCTVEFEDELEPIAATTDDNGVATFEFPMGKQEGYATVTCEEMDDPLAERDIRLNSPKPMVSKVSEPPTKQGIQTTFRVTFHKDYMPVEKVVHVDYTDISGALVVATTIPVVYQPDGTMVAEGTVTAHTWGTMLVNLYCCAVPKTVIYNEEKISIRNVGFVTEGQHITLYPDNDVQIEVEGLRPRMKPGESAEFRVITKSKKDGAETAVGASLVDRAVISLLDPFEKTPGDRFYNPQLKVISTGGAGVLTWPVVDRNWGSPWQDIAYTDWGFKGPGEWVAGGRRDENGDMDKFEDGTPPDESSNGTNKPGDGQGSGGATFGGETDGEPSPDMHAGPGEAGGGGPIWEDEDSGGDDSRGLTFGDPDAVQDRKPQITIRTSFPETALWEPLLQTADGAVTLKVKMPDAITIQQLNIVASDKHGNVGLLRTNIEVRQDVSVRADAAATMTLGDSVVISALVRNHTDQAFTGIAKLSSDLLAVEGDGEEGADTREITVEPNGMAVVQWTARASQCGDADYTVHVEGGDRLDAETRSLYVRPAGTPTVTVERSTLSSNSPFRIKVNVDENSTMQTGVLTVSFPSLVPALQAWDSLEAFPWYFVGPRGTACRALCDVAMLEWLNAGGKAEDGTHDLVRQRLQVAAASLLSLQGENGSWGWAWAPDAVSRGEFRESVWLTALALRALHEMLEADVVVDTAAMKQAAEWLLAHRNDDGLWSTNAYFWEVHAPETDYSLSGEILATIARLAVVFPDDKQMRDQLGGIAKSIGTRLDSDPQNPREVAFELQGLLAHARLVGDPKMHAHIGTRINNLLRLKRDGHWEPHWYHAYGGMVELNATILDLLHDYDPGGYHTHRRELIMWLLSTREAWGAWHNELGTVTAIRALLAAGAGTMEEDESFVEILVNGERVQQIKIDPADPFLSAITLNHVDLSAHLTSGENTIDVVYDGRLQAPAMFVLRQWGLPPTPPADDAPALTIERSSWESAKVGEPVTISLTVTARNFAEKSLGVVRVVDSVPATMVVDTRSLRDLLDAGRIIGYRVEEGRVVIELANIADNLTIAYRLTATRMGTANHGGATVSSPLHPGIEGTTTGSPVTVAE